MSQLIREDRIEWSSFPLPPALGSQCKQSHTCMPLSSYPLSWPCAKSPNKNSQVLTPLTWVRRLHKSLVTRSRDLVNKSLLTLDFHLQIQPPPPSSPQRLHLLSHSGHSYHGQQDDIRSAPPPVLPPECQPPIPIPSRIPHLMKVNMLTPDKRNHLISLPETSCSPHF